MDVIDGLFGVKGGVQMILDDTLPEDTSLRDLEEIQSATAKAEHTSVDTKVPARTPVMPEVIATKVHPTAKERGVSVTPGPPDEASTDSAGELDAMKAIGDVQRGGKQSRRLETTQQVRPPKAPASISEPDLPAHAAEELSKEFQDPRKKNVKPGLFAKIKAWWKK